MSSESETKKAKKKAKKQQEKVSVTFSGTAGGANTPHKATKDRESLVEKEDLDEVEGTASADKPSEHLNEIEDDDINWDEASIASKLSDKKRSTQSGITNNACETTKTNSVMKDPLGVIDTTNSVMVETLTKLTLTDEFLATGTTLPAEILQEIGDKVNKKKELYFNTLSTTQSGKVTIRCKDRHWQLPVLESLEPDVVLAWVQRLKELTVDMSSYKNLILSDVSGDDKALTEQEVIFLKTNNPVQAFAQVLQVGLKQLLSSDALIQVQFMAGATSTVSLTISQILTVINELITVGGVKGTVKGYMKSMKELHATMQDLKPGDTAVSYILKLMVQINKLQATHEYVLNNNVDREVHTKLVLSVIAPISFRVYLIQSIFNDDWYKNVRNDVAKQEFWRDVRLVLKHCVGYARILDEQRQLNEYYLTQFSKAKTLSHWTKTQWEEFSRFDEDKSVNVKKRRADTADSSPSKKHKSSVSTRERKREYSPRAKKSDRDRSRSRDKEAEPPKAASMSKGGKPKAAHQKKTTCILCDSPNHKGNKCDKPCACGVIPNQVKDGEKRHNPWDCPKMQEKRGLKMSK